MRGRLRPWLAAVHRWLGIAVGLPFVLLGLTGSVLVFYIELDQWLNPVIRPERPSSGSAVSWAQVVARLQALPGGQLRGWRVEVPLTDTRPIMARQLRDLPDRRFSPRMVTLDPQTLAVTSDRLWGEFAATFIYDLHYSLAMGPLGQQVVGWIGWVSLLLLLAGFALWWPSGRRWPRALRPSLRLRRHVFWYDLHTKAGAYVGLFVAALAFTGAVLALPQVVAPVLAIVSSPQKLPTPMARATVRDRMIDADRAVAIASEVFPQARLRWIETPHGPDGVYRIRLHTPGEPSLRFPRTYVWIDPWSGEVLAQHSPAQHTGADTFLAWQHPLHNGEAFGLPGRILVCCLGLMPLLWLLSGLVRWRFTVRARRRAAQRTTHRPVHALPALPRVETSSGDGT